MAAKRAIAQGHEIGGELLFAIEEYSWFWGWGRIGLIWAKSPELALLKGVSYNA